MLNRQIEEALKWRYAAKKYDPARKISEDDWKTLLAALTQAPSSYGLQPWKFIVVRNPEVREKLKDVSYGQTQITDASHLIVLASREKVTETDIQKYIDRIAEVRGVSKESLEAFKQMMVGAIATKSPEAAHSWTQRQAYIALGFLLESAALLHIDATPMEGFSTPDYDKILELEGSGWKTVATVALGYRHAEDTFQTLKKVRFGDDDLFLYR